MIFKKPTSLGGNDNKEGFPLWKVCCWSAGKAASPHPARDAMNDVSGNDPAAAAAAATKKDKARFLHAQTGKKGNSRLVDFASRSDKSKILSK